MTIRLPRFRVVLHAAVLATVALTPAVTPQRADAAHKFHASLTQIEVNASAKTVEVAIRVFVDDLEEALTRRSGHRVRLETASDFDALSMAYVSSSLKLLAPDGEPVVFRWIGKEASVDVVWLYVEAPLASRLDGGRLENSLFFDLFDDQVNTVNLKDGKRRATLTFSTGDGPKPLVITADS